ncbi:MAG: tetratricopeptide repeat protein [Planctomycetaceae bacterium]|nr:tetratricopeptide repeat protein [Planctomycetaceae bacterium]
MFRFTVSLTLVAVCITAAFAQVSTQPQSKKSFKATPEVLKLLADVKAALPKDDANVHAQGLFRLLNLEMQFEDKAPAADTVKTIVPLAAALAEPQQTQLYEGISIVYADLGQYDEAVRILGNIKQDDERSRGQLNLAVKVIADQKTGNKKDGHYDLTALLNQAAAGAAAAKNAYSEALARIFIAQTAAQQGKKETALEAFAEARKTAKKLEEVEEQNVTDLIIRVQCETGFVAEALETLKSVGDADAKQLLTGAAAGALMAAGKTDEAEKLLKEIPAGDTKDKAVSGVTSRYLQTLTDVQIKVLAAAMSTPERKTQFLRSVMRLLFNLDRDDLAAKLGSELPGDKDVQNALQLKPLKALLDAKKYDDAAKLIDTLNDEPLKTAAKRQLAVLRYRETGDESFVKGIPETYSDEEKKQLEEVENRFKQAAEMTNNNEQTQALFQILQAEYQLGNIAAMKKTLAFLLTSADKQSNPAKNISLRFMLARLQLELHDKTGAIANLAKLQTAFAAVKDVMELKELVPPKEEDNPIVNSPANGPAVKLRVPPTKAEVEAQVFNVYLTTADILRKAGAVEQSKDILLKARAFADALSDAVQKADMLFFLTQFVLQSQE